MSQTPNEEPIVHKGLIYDESKPLVHVEFVVWGFSCVIAPALGLGENKITVIYYRICCTKIVQKIYGEKRVSTPIETSLEELNGL